ncbi:MAG TPA: hypothetical protein VML75_25700 [Kofleriaceae bacterium]|nr:hypothetical protein [Kofleriaceae bacterium]
MFDWIGSLQVRESSARRVVLSLSKSTQVAGLLLFCVGAYATYLTWPISEWLALLPGLVAGLGLLLFTLRRSLVFDREAGVLRVDQRAFGLISRSVVPLFHLRAVVIVARNDSKAEPLQRMMSRRRYLAYVERRVGDAIYLDEAKRCAGLLKMAELIADVAELRLEYDAMWRAHD